METADNRFFSDSLQLARTIAQTPQRLLFKLLALGSLLLLALCPSVAIIATLDNGHVGVWQC